MAFITPFVILSSARSGSTHLATLLAQHPSIRQYQEVFHPALRFRCSVKGRVVSPNSDGGDFARSLFEGDRSNADVSAVGFKLMYHHARTGPSATVWNYLGDLTALQVIHLVRRNLFEVFVSRQVAERSRIWHVRTSSADIPYADSPICVDVTKCTDYFNRVRIGRLWALDRLKMRLTTSVDYNDLCSNEAHVLERLFCVLHLPPHALLKPVLRKIEQLKMRERVSNYDELKAHFRGSEHAEYFPE